MTIGEEINAAGTKLPAFDARNQLAMLVEYMGGNDDATIDWEVTDPKWREYLKRVMALVPKESITSALLLLCLCATAAAEIPTNKTTPLFQQRGLTTCSMKENEMAAESVASETWKNIAGYEGQYQASDCGRIRSLDRWAVKSNGRRQRFSGKVLRPSVHKDGYRCVNLQNNQDIKGRLVHRLVFAAFNGAIPDGMEVNHKDGNKANNALDNLDLMTPSENCRHRDRNGLRMAARGERSGQSKLKTADVLRIVGELSHLPPREVAPLFGVHADTIRFVRNGVVWSHVTGIKRKESPCTA